MHAYTGRELVEYFIDDTINLSARWVKQGSVHLAIQLVLIRLLHAKWDVSNIYIHFSKLQYQVSVIKVSSILPDLWSGAHKFYYREIRGPIDINNAPGDISRISQGPWNW